MPRPTLKPLLLAIVASGLVAGGPLAALAHAEGSLGGSSLTEQAESQAQKSTTTTRTGTTSTESTSSSSNTGSIELLGTIIAVALLIGIGFVIVRDARRRAPVSDEDLDAAEARVQHDRAARMQRRRAKSKAAKQQRKKNR